MAVKRQLLHMNIKQSCKDKLKQIRNWSREGESMTKVIERLLDREYETVEKEQTK